MRRRFKATCITNYESYLGAAYKVLIKRGFVARDTRLSQVRNAFVEVEGDPVRAFEDSAQWPIMGARSVEQDGRALLT